MEKFIFNLIDKWQFLSSLQEYKGLNIKAAFLTIQVNMALTSSCM